jgi:hypothetical protein
VYAVCHDEAGKADACLVFHGILNYDKGVMPLGQIVAEDRLREIPGVGDAIVDIVAKLGHMRA